MKSSSGWKKSCFWILSLFLVGLECVFITRGPQEALSATEILEWDVSAYCTPHVDINSTVNVTLTILPKTTVSGPEIFAYMSLTDLPTQNAIAHAWQYPTPGWHALLFQGPPVRATFYCQSETPTNRSLHISYLPDQNTKLFLSSQASMTKTEVDTIGSEVKKSTHSVQANPEQIEIFSAGLNSLSPYWLTFGFSLHTPHVLKTTLQFQFE